MVAVDVRPDALELAKACGADHLVPSSDGAAAAIREITRGRGAEAVFDMVGSDATLQLAGSIVAVNGHIGLVGLAGGSLAVSLLGLPFGLTVTPTYWGTLPELHEVLQLAGRGDLAAHKVVYPLGRADEAYAAVRSGTVLGRAVVVPWTATTSPFEAIGLGDAPTVGGKGANLGELTKAGFPVPPGFVIAATGFLEAMDEAGVRHELARLLSTVDPDNPKLLDEVAERLAAGRARRRPARDARATITSAYRGLGSRAVVAVRSSATGEDGATSSFAGMNKTYTNVVGEDEVLARVLDCWMSIYGSARARLPGDARHRGRARASRSWSNAWSSPASRA